MKKINYTLSLLALLSCVFILSNCKDDEDGGIKLTEQQQATKPLGSGSPWKVTTVTSKPNVDVDEDALKQLEFTFGVEGTDAAIAPGSFSTSGADDFFATETGATWSWSGSGVSEIEVTESTTTEITDIEFSPNAENPTSITVTFNRPAPSGGRSKALVGDYSVILE